MKNDGWYESLFGVPPATNPACDTNILRRWKSQRLRLLVSETTNMEGEMSFRISALPAGPFAALFGQAESVLAANGMRRVTATQDGGFPCRVSLVDAAPGERVLLLNYEHLPVESPYRARHAIYVREDAEEAHSAVGEVPESLRKRVLSVRAFDHGGMMVGAEVTEGLGLEGAIGRLLGREKTAFLHVHYAGPGCYAARVDRV